jgi:hypothetical protein
MVLDLGDSTMQYFGHWENFTTFSADSKPFPDCIPMGCIFPDGGVSVIASKKWTSEELEELAAVARWIKESEPCPDKEK